ncbi:hypothetical protein D9X30_2844 [Cupriavidus sp. U2]|nr:hypothetical protein D9X30_2844 [Cupriavidus sp. U2]
MPYYVTRLGTTLTDLARPSIALPAASAYRHHFCHCVPAGTKTPAAAGMAASTVLW